MKRRSVEHSELPEASAPPRTHRRWVGVLLSLLIAGAGIYLAGDRRAGVRWFLGLLVLSLVAVALASMPAMPGLWIPLGLGGIVTALSLWMLVISYRPVPKLGLWGWLLFLVGAAVLSGLEILCTDHLTRAFKVPTGSMEPAVLPGDHLFVQTAAYGFSAPKRGEVVAFRTEALNSPLLPKGQIHLKRVAGLPGEAIQISEGRLVVNGHALTTPSALAGRNFGTAGMPIGGIGSNVCLIPEGSFFVVGDNATNSLDSRFYGPIPRRSLVGRATKVYWPLARAGDIR